MSVYLTLTLPVYNLETRQYPHANGRCKEEFLSKAHLRDSWMCDSHTHPTNKKLHQVNLLCVCVCVICPQITQLSVITQDRLKLLINTGALTGSACVFRHLGVVLPTLTYFVTRHAICAASIFSETTLSVPLCLVVLVR